MRDKPAIFPSEASIDVDYQCNGHFLWLYVMADSDPASVTVSSD